MGLINDLILKMETGDGKLVVFHKRKKLELTFASLLPRVMQAASYLKNGGFGTGSTLGIIGKNDLDWIIADLACICCGIKLLPLDLHTDLVHYHENNLELSALLIGDAFEEQLESIKNLTIPCILLRELAEQNDCGITNSRPYKYDPDEILSYKSTSGSTGTPKVIGHSVQGAENSIEGTQAIFHHTSGERVLVFLPLDILQQRYWIYSAILYNYTVIVVPKEYVFVAIKQDQPTVIMGVPYIYELIADDFKASLKKNDLLRQAFEDFTTNRKNERERFEPFNDYLGGHINYLWTGSAPITKDLVDFYFQMGIPIYQGYGMNETCIIAKNYHGHNKTGSVGKLFPGIELKFDDSHQIIVKSQFPVCENYVVAAEMDRLQTFMPGGYIATGDLGYIDEDGFLYINGRIKDMIVLSSSKKILPQAIEEKIKCIEIANCILYGDNKPYLVAMLLPANEQIPDAAVFDIVQKYNENAAEDEKIIRCCIRSEKLMKQDQFFTNQHKIKRRQVYESFHSEFEALYN